MTDIHAIQYAIIADPDEDTLRLAAADWYAENGDPERSEFIRIEVELHRFGIDRRRGRARRTVLEPRRAELIQEHGGRWVGGLARLLTGLPDAEFLNEYGFRGCQGGAWWLWDRGFVSLVSIEAGQIPLAPQIVEMHPTVEGIEVRRVSPSTFWRDDWIVHILPGIPVGWYEPGTAPDGHWTPPAGVHEWIVGDVVPPRGLRGAKCFANVTKATRALRVAVAAFGHAEIAARASA